MISYLWNKIKKARYYVYALVLSLTILLELSPYFILGMLLLALGLDKIINHLD